MRKYDSCKLHYSANERKIQIHTRKRIFLTKSEHKPVIHKKNTFSIAPVQFFIVNVRNFFEVRKRDMVLLSMT